jgi:hypothetical protein
MDEQFDRLSRAMAGSLPRRRALRLIAATAAGMGAAMLGLRPLSVQASCSGTCQCLPNNPCTCYGNGPNGCGGNTCVGICKDRANVGKACTC